MDKSRYFLDHVPPLLVHVVIECPPVHCRTLFTWLNFLCACGVTMWSGCDVLAIGPAKNARQKKFGGLQLAEREQHPSQLLSLVESSAVVVCYYSRTQLQSHMHTRGHLVFCHFHRAIFNSIEMKIQRMLAHTGSNFFLIVVARAISNSSKNHSSLICRI